MGNGHWALGVARGSLLPALTGMEVFVSFLGGGVPPVRLLLTPTKSKLSEVSDA